MSRILAAIVAFCAGLVASTSTEGRGSFSPNCQPYPNQRVVMVTVSVEFLEFFKNWLHHATPYLQSTEKLVVMAEDATIVPKLKEVARTSVVKFDTFARMDTAKRALLQAKRAKTSLLQFSSEVMKGTATRASFGSRSYGAVVTKRPDRLLTFLRRDCTVLYVDIDSAWAKDPFKEIENAGAHDLYITDDSLGNRGVHKWYACTCFLYLQPTVAVKQLVDRWSAGLNGQWRNQPLFNELMKQDYESTKSVDFAFLPFEAFPPGGAAHRFEDVSVYHANYLKGSEKKIEFLKDHNLWGV